MQTSTIMLDSTLGKILTNKRVDSPVQKELTNKFVNSDSASSSDVAEVRIVARFIVEEQLVYNGKVERVDQLNCEEVIRVVSRVAWDSVKDRNKPANLTKVDLAQEEQDATQVQELEEEPQSPCSPTNATNTNSDPSTLASTIDPSAVSVDNVQEKPQHSNINSSDHMAYVKSIPSQQVVQNDEESSIAQVKQLHCESNTTTKCDILDLEQSIKNVCDIDSQIVEKSPEDPQSIETQAVHRTVIVEVPEPIPKHCIEPYPESSPTNFVFVDNQSILDTLNECLHNVDLENQVHVAEFNETVQSPHRDRNLVKDDNVQQVEALELLDDQVVEIPFETEDKLKKIISDTDTPITGLVEAHRNNLTETTSKQNSNVDSILINQASSKTNSSRTSNHPKENTSSLSPSLSHKGKSSQEKINSSTKRIHRNTPKEHKNLKTRMSANKKIAGRHTTKQDSSSGKATLNSSSLFNHQQVRQNKIFAKWSDNYFYPGNILKVTKDRKFLIGFFDGAQKSVPETDLVPLCNIKGKQVRVSIAKNYCVNAIVHEQSPSVGDQPMFDVEYQQEGIVKKCVPLKDIFLTADQGTPLINLPDKNSSASNFADVDLDNIIYEKRSRRLQEMEDFEFTENSSIISNKRKRGQYNTRNVTPKVKSNVSSVNINNNNSDCSSNSPTTIQKRLSQNDASCEQVDAESPDTLKTNFLCPNSNPPSESSSSTGSSNVPSGIELGQEFYFTSSSPHRTKTSLLL